MYSPNLITGCTSSNQKDKAVYTIIMPIHVIIISKGNPRSSAGLSTMVGSLVLGVRGLGTFRVRPPLTENRTLILAGITSYFLDIPVYPA